MVPQFNQAVLEGKVGDVVKVETEFGFHIIRITGKKDPVKKVRVATITRAIVPSKETYQATFLAASDFATRNNTIDKFNQAVTEKGLNKRTADNQGIMSNNIPGVEFPRQILYWAFNDKTNPGEVSPVFDMGKSSVVAVLKKRYEEGIATLENARTRMEPLVKREKKAEILISRIQQALQQTQDITELARRLNTKVDTLNSVTFGAFNLPGGYGPEKEVIGTIFSMKPGQLSGATKGVGGVYVMILDKIDEPTPINDFTQQKKVLASSVISRAGQGVYNALEEKTDIEDNRIKFY
jgi:parvulin-like peptidyl-prolyl isomerase